MQNRYVELVEKTLRENPSMMKIGNQIDDLDSSDIITFGFFKGDLYSIANVDGIVSINGNTLDEDFYSKYYLKVESDIDEDDRYTSMESLIDIPNIKQTGFHFNLVKHASFYNIFKEYFDLVKPNMPIDRKFDLFSDTIDKYEHYFEKIPDGDNSTKTRDGLTPAGRIFPKIKGISFYNPMEISNTIIDKIFSLLNLPDKENYVIEYQAEPSKYVQRPYKDTKDFKQTGGRELSDTEVANDLLAKLAQKKRADDRMDREARSKYHSYGPNRGG